MSPLLPSLRRRGRGPLPLLPLAALAALVLLPAPARAQITTYGHRAGFNAVTTGLTTFNFDGYSPSGYTRYYNGFTVQGVAFTPEQDGGTVGVQNPDTGYDAFGDGSQFLTTDASTGQLEVGLPAGATAFGADFDIEGESGTGVARINGQNYTFTIPEEHKGFSFFGFTSTVPITSLAFSTDAGVPFQMDNVSYGRIAPVPEASSAATLALLLALGLGVRAARRTNART